LVQSPAAVRPARRHPARRIRAELAGRPDAMSLPAPASLRPVLAAVKAKALRGGLRPALTAAAVRRLISAGGNGPQERLTRPQDQQSGKTESLPNSGRCNRPDIAADGHVRRLLAAPAADRAAAERVPGGVLPSRARPRRG